MARRANHARAQTGSRPAVERLFTKQPGCFLVDGKNYPEGQLIFHCEGLPSGSPRSASTRGLWVGLPLCDRPQHIRNHFRLQLQALRALARNAGFWKVNQSPRGSRVADPVARFPGPKLRRRSRTRVPGLARKARLISPGFSKSVAGGSWPFFLDR